MEPRGPFKRKYRREAAFIFQNENYCHQLLKNKVNYIYLQKSVVRQ